MNYIILFIVPILFLSSCSNNGEVSRPKYFSTYSTQTGNITIKDDIITTVEGSKTSTLAFRASGIITDIYVHPGDKVKKGQVLARLGNRESGIQVSGLSRIESEIQNLGQATSLIHLGTENIGKATEKLYDERIGGIEANITSLENKIKQTKQDLGNKTLGLQGSFEVFAQDFDRISTSMLYEGDKILGITTNFEYANNGWEPYLGTRAGTSRVDADNKWNTLYALRGKIRAYIEKGVGSSNINIAIQDLHDAYIESRGFGISMNYMLQNSVIGGGLAEETLNNWLTIWKGLGGETQKSESDFILWKNSTSGLMNTSSGTESVAEKDIISLELELANLFQSKKILLAEKEAKNKEIRTNISSIQLQKGEVSIQLAQTQMNTLLAKESSTYGVVEAPYDGVILEKYLEEGVVAGAGNPLLKISSIDSKIIKTYINNELYLYEKGASIFGSLKYGESSYTGKILLIQEQKDPLYNKNYIEVSIPGDISVGEKLTLHLERKKSTLQNGILIPLSSIILRYGPPGVYLYEDGKARFQLIKLLGSDMSYAEVLGIESGAIIITDGKENIYDGERLD